MGEEFLKNYYTTKWLAFGIADRLYPNYDEFDNKLFMLASTKSSIQYWRDNYEHYLYQDGEMNKIMVVVELPINNRNDFLMGSYSTLYPENSPIIDKFITIQGKQHMSLSWSVVNKTEELRQAFEKKVNKDFKVNQEISHEQEYEYPPVLSREVFNF
jgi:hypothetical protein